MITYRIGNQAEKVIAVRINVAGQVMPILRQRAGNGDLVAIPAGDIDPSQVPGSFEFIVRVPPGHSGTLEILPGKRKSASAHTLIPLGADLPLLESELPPTPGAAGAGWQSREVNFRFHDQQLSWWSNNIAGQVDLGEQVPAVTVALRLPRENDGEILFSPYQLLISTADPSFASPVDLSATARAKDLIHKRVS